MMTTSSFGGMRREPDPTNPLDLLEAPDLGATKTISESAKLQLPGGATTYVPTKGKLRDNVTLGKLKTESDSLAVTTSDENIKTQTNYGGWVTMGGSPVA